MVFQPVCHAGSGLDNWGVDTLVNLPPGKSRGTVPNQAGDNGDSAPIEVPCQCSDAGEREKCHRPCFHFGVVCLHSSLEEVLIHCLLLLYYQICIFAADPRQETTQDLGTRCFFHRVYNNCNQNFMFDANAELAPEVRSKTTGRQIYV